MLLLFFYNSYYLVEFYVAGVLFEQSQVDNFYGA
jgi:hypothetical protein